MSEPDILPQVTYSVRFIDGPEVEFEVERFVAEEGINCCYRLIIDVTTDQLEFDLEQLLGSSCELLILREEFAPSPFYGVVDRVVYLSRQGHHLGLRVRAVSAFELAKQRVGSRIWQDQSVQKIVTQVLDAAFADFGRALSLDNLTRATEPRDYCVQYRESDFDFVCRLLEEEGISWFFVHDLDSCKEILTLCDHNEQYPAIENIDGTATIPLIAHNPDEGVVEAFDHFDLTEQMTSNAAARTDFDFLLPSEILSASHQNPDARGWIRRIYDHGQRRFVDDDLAVRVQDLVEAHLFGSVVATAEGNTTSARPGRTFMLEDTDLEFEEGQGLEEWLITRAWYDSGEGGALDFRPRFECVPKEALVRPLQTTPKPRVHGPQTATVVGEGEIDVDEHGRIEVQFHWEEGASFAPGASCRVRCAQSWAGGGWGAQFIPRVGMEVVVEFLDGNPDRPLVTGCVYNGKNAPPFSLPANSSQSGWRTNSTPDGGGFNELRFEDAAGAEEIFIHAQRNKTIEIHNDRSQTIGNDESLSVTNDRSRSVGNNESIEIGNDREIQVGVNFTETIGADMSQTVGANQSVSVGASRSVSVGADQSLSISTTSTETVGTAKVVTVGAAMQTTVGAAMNTVVGAASAEEVGGAKIVTVGAVSSETVAGAKSLSAASISASAKSNLSVSAGAKISVQSDSDATLATKGDLAITGKKKGHIALDDKLIIEVGKAKIVLEKNGNITIKGAKINIEGSNKVKIKGSKASIN